MSGRVLVIDDGATVRVAILSALRRQGFVVGACDSRTDLVRALDRVAPEVVIVDPEDRPCTEVVQIVRRHSRAAVLLLASRSVPVSEIQVADECLRRPFTMIDLIARVRVHCRRRRTAHLLVRIGDLEISRQASVVAYRGMPIELTRTERRLLGFLAAHAGEVCAKKDLLAGVWGSEHGDPNVVEVNISTLRRKLERHGPRVVHTVRGRGYRLGEAPVPR